MPPISPDNPVYFLTSVTNRRLPVFRTDTFKHILATAFDEARISGSFKIFGYVIMPEHYHVVTDGVLKPSQVLRYLNGISARRVIDHLKKSGPVSSLQKLRKDEGRNEYKYSLWEHHSNTFIVTTESILMQKINYIHRNPVEDGMVENVEDYKYSSVRFWNRRALLEDEPLDPDIKSLQSRS